MVSLTRAPSINRGDLARQSLLLRPALILLFAAVSLWVSGLQYPVLLVIIAYTASSVLLAAGYRSRLLGSSDIVYAGMVDTSLFLGAGAFLTGGAVSPVLYLFFGLQATYFVLATPRTFIITAALSVAVMIASVVLANSKLALLSVDPTQQPLAYLVAAGGSLAMMSTVGWAHSLLYVTRSQAHRHLTAALSALHRLVGGNQGEKRLVSFLGPLMATLNVADEGAIYRFDQNSGTLLLEEGIGLRPWFQKFPVFWPEEGVVGQAYRLKKRVIYKDSEKLRQCYGNLSQRNLEVLEQVAKKSDPPNYTIAVPLSWADEVLGILVLSRQQGSLDDREVELVEGFAAQIATVMHGSQLEQQVAELNHEVKLHHQFQNLLTDGDSINRFQDFAEGLRDFIDFEGIRIAVATSEGLESDLGYFCCSESLVLGQMLVDTQASEVLHGSSSGSLFLSSVNQQDWQPEESFMSLGMTPELAEQGVGSIAGIVTERVSGSGEQLQGVLLLLHRDPAAYGPEHLPILESLRPVLGQLTNLAVTSSGWQKKTRQMNSLQNIMSLTHASGDEEQVIRNLIQGAVEQLGGSGPHVIAAIVADESRGALKVTQWAPDSDEGFTHSPAGDNTHNLKELLLAFNNQEVEIFLDNTTAGQSLCQLLGVVGQVQFACFSLCSSEKPMGVLVIRLSQTQPLNQGQQDSIQQLADVAGLCLSITRQQEAQARQTRELQHEDELRRSFLSYITHEFRTPLASLKTSFELIQESEMVRSLEDPYQRLLVNVNRSVTTLEQLTNDLSEVANISAGGVILNKALTSPELIVYPVLEATAPLSHLKSQSLEIEIPQDLPRMVADAHRLEQVLTNMISNAIKYTPAGGTIRASVCQENGSIKFVVSDTGRGIPQEDLEKVFEPFYRVPQEAQDRTPGTGLGLALAKSLVELHGGQIWVESEPQKGSTFIFTIPIESRDYETANH